MHQAYKVLASFPAEETFLLFLAPVEGRGHGERQQLAPQSRQASISHTAIFWQGGGISHTCRRGKAFGPKSPAQAAPGTCDGTRAGRSKPPPALGLSQWSVEHGPDRCHSNKQPDRSWESPRLQQCGTSVAISMLAL